MLPNPTQEGQVGGHEGVGKIVKMGPGTENSPRKVGDRVGIKWISAICGSCPACLAGHDGICFNQKISGYYTPGTVGSLRNITRLKNRAFVDTSIFGISSSSMLLGLPIT